MERQKEYIQKLPLFSDAKEEDYANIECFSCQDIGSEIRFAYQYFIERQIPAEQAVIVCPDDSYPLRIVEEGKLLGFGVDNQMDISCCFSFPVIEFLHDTILRKEVFQMRKLRTVLSLLLAALLIVTAFPDCNPKSRIISTQKSADLHAQFPEEHPIPFG